MSKGRIILSLVVLAVVVSCALHLYSQREPSYQGKKLSKWVDVPTQEVTTPSLILPRLVDGSSNGENGQHIFREGMNYPARYLEQERIGEYVKAMAEFTRTGRLGNFYFIVPDLVVRENRPLDPQVEIELMSHRSLHLIDTRHQPQVDLIDTK